MKLLPEKKYIEAEWPQKAPKNQLQKLLLENKTENTKLKEVLLQLNADL